MSNVIQFPARGAVLERKVAELERQVAAWMADACPSYLVYSENVARWVADPGGLAGMLRRLAAAGGRVADADSRGIRDWEARVDLMAAEIAAEYLGAHAATPT